VNNDTEKLPREVDPLVFNMSAEDPGNISYSAVGGLGEQIREIREVKKISPLSSLLSIFLLFPFFPFSLSLSLHLNLFPSLLIFSCPT